MSTSVYLPSNLDIPALLQSKGGLNNNQRNIDALQVFCSMIARQKISHGAWEEENDGFVNLYSPYLKKLHSKYDDYMEWLIQAGVIITDNHFILGEKSRGYKFSSGYCGMGFKEVEITDYLMSCNLKEFQNNIEKAKKKELKPCMHMLAWVETKKMGIDDLAAKRWIKLYHQKEYYKILHQPGNGDLLVRSKRNTQTQEERIKTLNDVCSSMCIFVDKIATGNYSLSDFSICKFGHRLHGMFTYTMKELRCFITYDGMPLVSVDVKNSQPYFAIALFNKLFWLPNSDSSFMLCLEQAAPDLYNSLKECQFYAQVLSLFSSQLTQQDKNTTKQFISLVARGEFYEHFQEKLMEMLSQDFLEKYGHLLGERSQIKEETLRVFYCKNKVVNGSFYLPFRVFKALFPLVTRLFMLIKNNKKKIGRIHQHNTLAAILQRIESYCILELCGKIIKTERPELFIMSIHDSIITTEGNEPFVEEVIKNVLETKIGMLPKVAVEKWLPELAFQSVGADKNAYICQNTITDIEFEEIK